MGLAGLPRYDFRRAEDLEFTIYSYSTGAVAFETHASYDDTSLPTPHEAQAYLLRRLIHFTTEERPGARVENVTLHYDGDERKLILVAIISS